MPFDKCCSTSKTTSWKGLQLDGFRFLVLYDPVVVKNALGLVQGYLLEEGVALSLFRMILNCRGVMASERLLMRVRLKTWHSTDLIIFPIQNIQTIELVKTGGNLAHFEPDGFHCAEVICFLSASISVALSNVRSLEDPPRSRRSGSHLELREDADGQHGQSKCGNLAIESWLIFIISASHSIFC